MKVKEESEKGGSKLNIQKTKIMSSHHFMANRRRNSGSCGRLYFLGSKITADLWCWRILLRVTWTARRSSQSILKCLVICISEVFDNSFPVLILAYYSASPVFLMMYSVYKLNKQDNNIQTSYTPFSIWNQSVIQYPILTIASWPAYRSLSRQIRWCDIPVSWRIFYSLLWSTHSKALAWSKKPK